jgi:peroxiredoxin family protein
MTAPAVEPDVEFIERDLGVEPDLLGFLESAVIEAPVEETYIKPAVEASPEVGTKQLVIILMHNDLESLWATMILLTSSAASGMKTSVFMTFWGLLPFVRDGVRITGDNWMQKMLAFMQRPGIDHPKMSKLQFFGMGPWMMRRLAKQYNDTLPHELLDTAKAMGVSFYPCQMSMELFGVSPQDLPEGFEAPVGAATVLELMTQPNTASLFI